MDKLKVFNYSLNYKAFKYLQDKCMEEMTELMKAIFKARERGYDHTEDIEQEFADTQLMLDQLRYCYDSKTDGDFSRRVEVYTQLKCDKLWSIWHDGIIPEDK
jgi:hypothetical protein